MDPVHSKSDYVAFVVVVLVVAVAVVPATVGDDVDELALWGLGFEDAGVGDLHWASDD